MNPDRLDWEDLRAFRAVLRDGSLSAAARALGVTQPTMRRRLDALEQALGAALFTRAPTGLAPTEAARALADHADAMAAAAAALARAASADPGALAGAVRITASEIVGAEVLPPMLAALQAAHPGLAIELHLSNRAQDLLRQEADIAIRMLRPAQDALVARRVGEIVLGLYAHPAYLARHGAPADLAALAGHVLIGPDRESGDLAAIRASGLPLERIAFRTDSHLAQLAAIDAGIGIGICQVALGARRGLVHLLPHAFRHALETWVVMHEDLRRTARVRTAFDHLVRGLAAYASGRAQA
jgi:DNA-binding transcriptional LysR family regulator